MGICSACKNIKDNCKQKNYKIVKTNDESTVLTCSGFIVSNKYQDSKIFDKVDFTVNYKGE